MVRNRNLRALWLLLLLLLVAGSAALGGWMAWRRALGGIGDQAGERLNLHALAVQRLIDRFRVLPRVLALDPELRAALEGPPDAANTAALNAKLDRANDAVKASTLTLLDRHGRALAANNWNTPESNVGLDYAFRPYFRDAMRDGYATFYALGVSTNVPGYFIAQAVEDTQGRRIGVVVLKISLDALQEDWAGGGDVVFLSDAHNVVFLANHPEWVYRTLYPLSPADAASIAATRQYGTRPLSPMTWRVLAPQGADTLRVRLTSPSLAHDTMWRSLAMPKQAWRLHLLADTRPAVAAARNAVFAVLAAWLPVLLLGMFFQQRVRMARLRQRSREELERMVAHHASALRSAQDSIVAAASEAAQGGHGSLEHLPQGVSVVDAELRLVAWNTRYQKIFGFPDEYMRVGRPIEDMFRFNARKGLLGPGDTDEAIERRLQYLRAGSPHMYERERPDGSTLEIRGNPLPGGGFVTSYADITAYKAAARELRSLASSLEQRVEERTRDLIAAKAEADKANRSRTRFVAAAVHDLLQPLNAARMFIGSLASGKLDGEGRDLVERVRSALDTQDELLASLLDISRLEGGAVAPRMASVSLEPMLAELARQSGVLASTRGLELGHVRTSLVVRSDALLLRRVLQNFLSNAIHYTPRGRVLLGVRRAAGQARIEVWDTGVGIPEAKTRAIFDEFLRLDNGVDRDRRSAGLGLSIVDRIARLLGATVAVRSWEGRGSVFSVTLPLADMAMDAPAAAPADEDDSPFAGKRILVIDNDPLTRRQAMDLLIGWGCEVTGVGSERGALRHAETDDAPALILMDDPMDGREGGALRAGLASRWGHLPPTVLMAAAPRQADIERAAAEGLRYLTKPLAPARLRAVMTRLLMVAG
ncbi:PAS-domain containing protein [Luteibacter aegosomaticola]|uniref:hybrid sensor histidine kinase/response regulator n=1 Tax=Luteibacter aegosomaticola TaxID=2911538 RepID=UPI001FFB19C2|nr:PAS-domain containing protein [Luteibacter aegosomaticola]UPG90006.1 PAS-domain containing protein [Luteibacter aegosomaticola]